MDKIYITETNQKLTEEQHKEIEEAKKTSIVFDEDCPGLSPAMMKAFRCAVIQRNQKNKMLKDNINYK